MTDINGYHESNLFDYFSIFDYIKKIKLTEDVLYHSEETCEDLIKYMNKLKDFNDFSIKYFLIASFNEEIMNSNLIENHITHPGDINSENIYSDTLSISHQRIKKLHQFAADNMGDYDYRENDAWVSNVTNGEETIFWYGAKPEDIKKFIDDFIIFFKNHTNEYFSNNIFLRTALIHLIFMRIHPFRDGNSRTSRIIADMKFIDLVNRLFKLKLKLSPLHISQSILLNHPTYNRRRNAIYFDNIHDDNEALNNWFNFILNMYDEQICYMTNLLEDDDIVYSLNYAENLTNDDDFDKIAKYIRIKN